MKLSFILFICLVSSLSIIAQTSVNGNVSDAATNQTLSSVRIILTDTSQKKIISSVETDGNGNFELKINSQFTTGLLTVGHSGYATYQQKIGENNLTEKLQIVLLPVGNELAEVTINAKQNAVTVNGDKIIFNIEKSGIGDGNNGLETVRQIPGIRLDKDENIQFRGSSDVQIMINGKKSLLQGDALREFIRSLKGNDIQRIEIIAQPSARYDATGTTGIINIVLKKNRAAGFSGNLYTSTAYGEYFKNQNGGRLFYNDSLWAINTNGSYYDGNSVNHRQVKQNIQLETGQKVIDQHNEWLPATISKSLNAGIERKLNKHQLISTEWQYYKSNDWDNTYGVTHEYLNKSLINIVKLTQFSVNPTERITGNVFYNYTSDSTTTKFDVQINYANYKDLHTGYQRNDYSNATFMQLDGFNKTMYNIINAQADIKQQLSKKVNLEAGIKYSDVKMNYFNNYITNNISQLFIPDSLLTNDFIYKEHLAAGYTQLSIDLSKWSFLAGIRAEHYKYDAISRINKQANKRNYTNYFPSFSINYKKENDQYQLSYSRRISRPNYLTLNPYYQYIDTYTIERGNPYLQPQLYHSFQLSYVYKNALSVSLYGYLYNKGFVSVIDYKENQNYNLTYQANASTGNRFGISAALPYEPFYWWTMQLSLDAAYNYEKSKITDFIYAGHGFSYDISLYQNFNLKHEWSFNWNGFYTGRATTPNGYSKTTYDFSISGKKLLLDKKLQVAAGCSNILKYSFYNQITKVDNVSTNWTNRWETRRFYFQLTYYFGGGNTKRVKSASLDDEEKRI